MLARIYLVRHGETAWSHSGQNTGLTGLPLTAQDERLAGMELNPVLTSPLEQARRTCELGGFGLVARIDPDLLERTTALRGQEAGSLISDARGRAGRSPATAVLAVSRWPRSR